MPNNLPELDKAIAKCAEHRAPLLVCLLGDWTDGEIARRALAAGVEVIFVNVEAVGAVPATDSTPGSRAAVTTIK